MAEVTDDFSNVSWHVVIRPDARLWSFRLSGGMSTRTFMRTLAPPEPRPAE